MTRGFVRGATEDDIPLVAPRLREADRNEVLAVTGVAPELSLRGMVQAADQAFALCTEDGTPQGLLGVTSVSGLEDAGYVWLLFTDALYDHRIEFLRRCREWLSILHTTHPLLLNYVDERNTVHVKWLRWLGFTILRRVPYGAEGRPFLEFVRYDECAYP